MNCGTGRQLPVRQCCVEVRAYRSPAPVCVPCALYAFLVHLRPPTPPHPTPFPPMRVVKGGSDTRHPPCDCMYIPPHPRKAFTLGCTHAARHLHPLALPPINDLDPSKQVTRKPWHRTLGIQHGTPPAFMELAPHCPQCPTSLYGTPLPFPHSTGHRVYYTVPHQRLWNWICHCPCVDQATRRL